MRVSHIRGFLKIPTAVSLFSTNRPSRLGATEKEIWQALRNVALVFVYTDGVFIKPIHSAFSNHSNWELVEKLKKIPTPKKLKPHGGTALSIRSEKPQNKPIIVQQLCHKNRRKLR